MASWYPDTPTDDTWLGTLTAGLVPVPLVEAPSYADEHEGGQLRIAVAGEQVPLLGLPDSAIPTSDEPQAVDELQREVQTMSTTFECDRCGATFDDGIDAGHHQVDHDELRRLENYIADTVASVHGVLTARDIERRDELRGRLGIVS